MGKVVIMFDWLRRVLRNYREFCEAEELRKAKITIKSGAMVPKEGAKAIVGQLMALQSNHYTKYSDLVRMSQGQKKLESPEDQWKLLKTLFIHDKELGADMKDGVVILTRNSVEEIYQIVCASIEGGVIVSPVEGMTLDGFLAS